MQIINQSLKKKLWIFIENASLVTIMLFPPETGSEVQSQLHRDKDEVKVYLFNNQFYPSYNAQMKGLKNALYLQVLLTLHNAALSKGLREHGSSQRGSTHRMQGYTGTH